jgi:hypothetical protein
MQELRQSRGDEKERVMTLESAGDDRNSTTRLQHSVVEKPAASPPRTSGPDSWRNASRVPQRVAEKLELGSFRDCRKLGLTTWEPGSIASSPPAKRDGTRASGPRF